MRFLIDHPPLRIVASMVVIIMGVSVHRLDTILYLLILGQGCLLLEKVPVRLLWERVRLIIPFFAFSLVFFAIYEQGIEYELFPWLSVSLYGFEKALIYSGRLLFTVQILTLMFYKLPIPAFFQSLIQLKVPAIFVELLLFTLRYMEVFRSEAKSMLKSLKSRGFRVSQWFSLHNYLTLSKLLGSLFVRSFNRSERVYIGMLSRGYKGMIPMKKTEDFNPNDKWKALVWVVPVISLFIWDKW
ncbi:cobalt ECF transporter T component CbiQ [Aneurinibacillus danicus]|uniref:Cobalt ECF transporter T component CbiQ n=1 Tax=Aneurinibacillus danicus TaxID=267746 RepID=A0A511V6I5_9BACL|nr:cobalt ECF transporter T component CbiQ [Aneurinibacillus danicus]GEN34369.1 cobalt ECF transporter T component CbiQ [Aneurinibacillus danicus]